MEGRCQVYGRPLCQPLTSELVSRSSSPHYFYAHTSGSSKNYYILPWNDVQDSQNTQYLLTDSVLQCFSFLHLLVISVFGVIGVESLPFHDITTIQVHGCASLKYMGRKDVFLNESNRRSLAVRPQLAASSHGHPKIEGLGGRWRYFSSTLSAFSLSGGKDGHLGTNLVWIGYHFYLGKLFYVNGEKLSLKCLFRVPDNACNANFKKVLVLKLPGRPKTTKKRPCLGGTSGEGPNKKPSENESGIVEENPHRF